MSKKEKHQHQTDNQENNTNFDEAQNTQNNENQTPNETDESFDEPSASDKMTENNAQAVQEWQDKYARLSAEFDNFRKRTLKEKMELVENGGADVLKSMLSTADDFDRALQHITDENTKAGVELMYNKFMTSLRSKGVEEMELIDKPFDVDFAEAIAKMPAPTDDQKGIIMDVAEKGYMLKDKVLRFAKVVVYQ